MASPIVDILAVMKRRRRGRTSESVVPWIDAEASGSADDAPRRRVVLLLGAGASVPAGIPHTQALVASLEAGCPDPLKPALTSAMDRLREWTTGRSRVLDVELLYETVLRLADADGDPLLSRVPGGDLPATRPHAEALKLFVENAIRQQMFAREEMLKYLEPLRGLVQSDGSLDVFSTNYDTCIELLCERLRLVWEDGYSVRWDPSVFKRRAVQVRLRKLHGSVLWYRDKAGGQFRSLVSGPTDPPQPDAKPRDSTQSAKWFGGECSPLILYPARKAGFDAPYVDNLAAFRRALGERDELVVLVVVGYSFRDDAIQKAVFDAARRNRLLAVVLVDPEAETIYQERLRVVDGKADVAAPLNERVLPFGLGLDVHPAVMRRVVSEVIDAAGDAHSRERDLIERDDHNAWSWGQLATVCLQAGHLHAYWRCLAKSGEHVLRSEYGYVIDEHLRELRLALEFGIPLPYSRCFVQTFEVASSRWFASVFVKSNGPDRFMLEVTGSETSRPGALDLAKHYRAAAEAAARDRGCVPSARERQRSVDEFSHILFDLARVLRSCSSPTREYDASSIELRKEIGSREADEAISPERFAAWATTALHDEYATGIERLCTLARRSTAGPIR